MADKADVLIQALRDHFASAEPQPAATTPDVVPAKNPSGPTLVRIPGTDAYEPLEKPRHLDSLSLEEKEQVRVEAEKKQADRIEVAKRLAQRVEEDHYRALIDGARPPVGSTGREDRNFFEEWKHIWVPKPQFAVEYPDLLGDTPEQIAARATFLEVHSEYIDWKATWGLRDIALSGYEIAKSARPGRNLAPVPPDAILEEIQKRVNPSAAPIRNNRFVHSEK